MTLISLLKRFLPLVASRSPKQQPWIVEGDRVGYREEESTAPARKSPRPGSPELQAAEEFV
ncbi:MAG: hypothetical protein WB607_13255, partial [Candidatus Acidiferrum sp.]